MIESRTGAGTIVATESVAGSAPDGNTVLLIANPLVINPHLRKVTYDPLTSFEPICHLVNLPSVIVVNSTSPYHTLADLFATARQAPKPRWSLSPKASFRSASAAPHSAILFANNMTNTAASFASLT